MNKKTIGFVSAIAGLLLSAVPVFAHVVVRPSQVGVAAYQTFTVGVPVEKDNPTVGLRLVIPNGMQEVMPNVKPGWTISVKKDGDTVTEIDWTGGSIPAGQRDDFVFSAQAPASETTVAWKAYQTYQDGSVVAWDKDPKTVKQGEEGTPYSETKVVNDLNGSSQGTVMDHGSMSNQPTMEGSKKAELFSILGFLGFVLSVVALGMQLRKRK